MRIISGKFKNKNIIAPEGLNTRPTSDKARQAIFNILDSLFIKEQKNWTDFIVFDAFAGTGAMGMEAISRGAKKLYYAENNLEAIKCIQKNLSACENTTHLHDATHLPPATDHVDILFMDPPYKKGLVTLSLTELLQKKWINTTTICVIETEKSEHDFLPDGFEIFNERTYGIAKVSFVRLIENNSTAD